MSDSVELPRCMIGKSMRSSTLSILMLLVAAGVGCSKKPTPRAANEAPPSSIGTATMSADGTITLRLRTGQRGVVGEGTISYKKGDKDYNDVLKHLGGLKPGETKPAPPWPD